LGLSERRIEIRHGAHPPAGRIRAPAAGTVRPDLGRRPVLVPFVEGAVPPRLLVLLFGNASEVEGAVGTSRSENRPQPREPVDPAPRERLLSHRALPAPRRPRSPPPGTSLPRARIRSRRRRASPGAGRAASSPRRRAPVPPAPLPAGVGPPRRA